MSTQEFELESEIWLSTYGLKDYAKAMDRYKLLKAERETYFESLYDQVSATTRGVDPETGLIFTTGARTESAAIRIIEQKEAYFSRMDREHRKATMFQKALDSLSEEERQMIENKYMQEHSLAEQNSSLLQQAEAKLCLWIKNEKDQRYSEMLRQKRANIKQKNAF